MKINKSKAKIFVSRKTPTRQTNDKLDDRLIEAADNVSYLENKITKDGKCNKNNNRIQQD